MPSSQIHFDCSSINVVKMCCQFKFWICNCDSEQLRCRRLVQFSIVCNTSQNSRSDLFQRLRKCSEFEAVGMEYLRGWWLFAPVSFHSFPLFYRVYFLNAATGWDTVSSNSGSGVKNWLRRVQETNLVSADFVFFLMEKMWTWSTM